jgi:tetratricopeptide (TPR) repeat protein
MSGLSLAVPSLYLCLVVGSLGSVGARVAPQTQSLTPPSAAGQQPARAELTAEQRADIFMARKSYADAVDYYARALRQNNTHEAAATIWNKMGISLQQEDDYLDARKSYKKALKLNPDLPEAWNNLGTTFFLQNKYGKSVKYYQHAIALEPSSASFHMNLGTSYTRMKKFPLAVGEYRAALTLDPTILTEHSSTGTVVQPREADAEYFYYMAKVFASLGRAPEAVSYLRRAFEEGFHNTKQLDEDPDFAKISKDAEYVALRNSPPVAIPASE